MRTKMQWLDIHPEKDLLVVCIGILLAVALAIYAGVKPYPEDFDWLCRQRKTKEGE